MPVSFISTRGAAPPADLRAATLAGLAVDGGLYVPEAWPQMDAAFLSGLKGKSYQDTAFAVLRLFTAGIVHDGELRRMIGDAYAGFEDAAVTPLKQLGEGLWVMELFHGPTFAFKDIALQLLGLLFAYFLKQSGQRMTVIGATSGDTGSAAMAALAQCEAIDTVILFPARGPSEIQRRQMSCMESEHAHAVAIEGSFDDCQAIVKALLADEGLRSRYRFGAINSINVFRLLAQMVYYVIACAHFAPQPVSFVVPTGNFGNVYAGYAALKSGLPVARLGVASNRNDILTRFFASGRMERDTVHPTLSPSMDIQISSNAERLIFDLTGRDGDATAKLMAGLAGQGSFAVTQGQLAEAKRIFTAASAGDAETLAAIADTYRTCGYLADPHSAVGLHAAKVLAGALPQPVVALACAHPAKFPDTVEKAIGKRPELPPALAALMSKKERITTLPASRTAVEQFLQERISP